jgi:hypothetical protein
LLFEGEFVAAECFHRGDGGGRGRAA